MSDLRVEEAGPADAEAVTAVIHRAFAARPALDPPSTALDETVESVLARLQSSGGVVVHRFDQPVGAVLFDIERPGQLGLRRVSVDPFMQAHGVASAMVGVAEDVAEARGLDGVWLTAREELPENLVFWKRRGYYQISQSGPTIELGKTLWLASELRTPEDTGTFGMMLAQHLGAGDLVVLTGELGAGKTTLTQGIGAGLEVRGAITSPTFVIARVHPSLVDGPALVHADAYRLGGLSELDDLDLDASVDEAVTVVEWGEGIAESLTQHRLEVQARPAPRRRDVARCLGTRGRRTHAIVCTEQPVPSANPETRVVSVRPVGARWVGARLRSTLL